MINSHDALKLGVLGAMLALVGSCFAEELPNAPEPMLTNQVPEPAKVSDRHFTRYDWALVGAEFAVRAWDFVTTMQCQHDVKMMQFQTGIGAGTYWKNVGCREYELPQSFVAGNQFAAFSFGVAALQTLGQYELTHHGHRTAARRLALVSIGATGATVISNKIRQ